MSIRGRVWRYRNNVDTDVIIPGRYCHLTDPKELAKYCLIDLDPEFARKVAPGDIIVAEENFGCGSSREVAPLTIKGAGVSAVIASSFARIFYRNAINIGLPIFESPEAVKGTQQGDRVELDVPAGLIRNLTTGREFPFAAFPPFVQQLIAMGGLLAYVEKRLAEKEEAGRA